MKLHPLTRVLALLAMFAVPGLAMQRPKPAPAPAPTPSQSSAEREQQAKEQQRLETARRAEQARLEQEQEATRIKRARQAAAAAGEPQDKDAERVKRAREEAAQPGGQIPGRERAELRETARDMFKIEDLHRDRLARIDRLIEIYRENGDNEKLAEVEKLKSRENKRYLLIMNQFKQKLGPAYAQFEPRLLAGETPKVDARKQEPHGPPPVPRREAKEPVKDPSKAGGR